MRINEVLLTLHILASATWIGAALALQVLAARVRPSTPDAVVDVFAVDAEVIGKRLFGPAAVVLLLTGVALVERQQIGWTEPWILLGVGALAIAGTIGGAFLIPEGRRLAQLALQPDHDPGELRDRTRRRFLVARVDLSILVLAVAVMVFRPGA
ncbi:MAG: DUF2269 family protein [Actinomycetota bacterium]